MKTALFLDDDKTRHQKITGHLICDRAYTVAETIDKLKTKEYDLVFLDHDLGGKQMVESEGEEETGYDVVKWIAEHKPKISLVIVHSLNPYGADNMVNLLKNSGYFAACVPFTILKSSLPAIFEWKMPE